MSAKLGALWARLRSGLCPSPFEVLRYGWGRLFGRKVLCGRRVRIRGRSRIETAEHLVIAMQPVGFKSAADRTWLNIRGRLLVRGRTSIGRGCRLDVGPGAVLEFCGGYVTADTTFVIMHGLKIGAGCAISWGCQFLDDDFHTIDYPGRREPASRAIVIGEHVWIGNQVMVLPGTRIADGCVIAGGSVVKGVFDEAGTLIGGNPARVLRSEVSWH